MCRLGKRNALHIQVSAVQADYKQMLLRRSYENYSVGSVLRDM